MVVKEKVFLPVISHLKFYSYFLFLSQSARPFFLLCEYYFSFALILFPISVSSEVSYQAHGASLTDTEKLDLVMQ